MERIETFECENRAASNWLELCGWLVDTSTGDQQSLKYYPETDVIFSLRFRSMYLAIALKQFVLNVTGNMKTQWTWKRCLQFAINAMNDVGVDFYSSFSTLARWHRKFALNRFFFKTKT